MIEWLISLLNEENIFLKNLSFIIPILTILSTVIIVYLKRKNKQKLWSFKVSKLMLFFGSNSENKDKINFVDRSRIEDTNSIQKSITPYIGESDIISYSSKLSNSERAMFFADKLNPFFSYDEVYDAIQFYIPTKCQNIDPAELGEAVESFAVAIKSEFIPFFLKNVFFELSRENKFFLILADSGMGKTTFMINLFCRTYELVNKKHLRISLIPLGYYDKVDERINKTKKKEKTILTFLSSK